jgi:hypothetical protein
MSKTGKVCKIISNRKNEVLKTFSDITGGLRDSAWACILEELTEVGVLKFIACI